MARSKKQAEQVAVVMEDVDAVAVLSDEAEEIALAAESVPKIGQTGWSDYVVSLLDDDEKEDGCPKVDGLRRITRALYGPFSSDVQVVEAPNINNAGRATVVVRVEFPKNAVHEMAGLVYSGAADVHLGNTPKEYANHATATAETRAEGRALRKLLCLKTLSAEEKKNATEEQSETAIPTGMLTSLKIMAVNTKVDLLRVAQTLFPNVQILETLTKEQGKQLSGILLKYSNKEVEIPDTVRV